MMTKPLINLGKMEYMRMVRLGMESIIYPHNMKAKLAGICFLHQAKENHIEKATKENAVKHLMNQVYRPRDIMAMSNTLEYVDKIVNEIPIYEMGCNISKEAAIVAYDAMKDGTL